MTQQLVPKLDLEQHAINLVAKLAPWLAPAPTAYLVYSRTVEHLAWPQWVGIVAALVIETLGLATTSTALSLWNYNHTRRKSDPAAPIRLPLALVALYFVAAELLTVVLDVAPKLAAGALTSAADWAPAIFPLLSLAGTVTLAIRADHQHRLATIAEDKERLRRARAETRRERQIVRRDAAETRRQTAEQEQILGSLGQTARQMLGRLAADPTQTQTELAQALKVKRQTIPHHLTRLESLGLIRRQNGHGIKVLVAPPLEPGEDEEGEA